jgi:hypothetical protein
MRGMRVVHGDHVRQEVDIPQIAGEVRHRRDGHRLDQEHRMVEVGDPHRVNGTGSRKLAP